MDGEVLQRRRRIRLRLFLVAILLAGARLAWSLFDVQVRRHASFEARAQAQQERRLAIPSRRGAIYDRNGVPLAVNRERYSVYLVPNHVRDPRLFERAFTAIVPYPRAELRARLARGGFYVPLLRSIDGRTVTRLEKARLPGVGVDTSSTRYYPHGKLAAAVIGQVDLDNRGIAGLELQYDRILRGRSGWAVHQRDALGHDYPNFSFPAMAAVDGGDLTLTLDVGLQEIAEEALDEAMATTQSSTGSVVVVDPRTGEVLAMANRPDADPNSVRKPVRNYAVVDVFEPGSTFKLVTLAGLYENGLADPDEEIFCENGRYLFPHRSKPVRDVHPYGDLTVEQVIGKSSNICTIKLAQRLGNEGMFEYARAFGFGLPTGIDFPGEARGVLRLPREWSVLTPYSVAMGYEVSVTALQLAMMFAAIANGGELLQPYLVGRAAGPDGQLLLQTAPRKVRRVVSRATAALMTRALVSVVREGTGTAAALELLQVAGKSGTAFKVRDGGVGYAADRYNSSFGGFFPADDPRLVVFVRLDDPRGEHYGGLVAGPVFKKAIETTLFAERVAVDSSFFAGVRERNQVLRLASHDGVPKPEVAYAPPSEPDGGGERRLPSHRSDVLGVAAGPDPRQAADVYGAVSGSGLQALEARVSHSRAGVGAVGVRVPDFTGMSLREALVVASQHGLELRFTGPGTVIAQEPAAGALVSSGEVVVVHDGDGP